MSCGGGGTWPWFCWFPLGACAGVAAGAGPGVWPKRLETGARAIMPTSAKATIERQSFPVILISLPLFLAEPELPQVRMLQLLRTRVSPKLFQLSTAFAVFDTSPRHPDCRVSKGLCGIGQGSLTAHFPHDNDRCPNRKSFPALPPGPDARLCDHPAHAIIHAVHAARAFSHDTEYQAGYSLRRQ